ncbi:MAG TPA: FAD-dependent oxidoreductase, partial [Rhizomicrobium sp.]|nr:FAD-dependent oxidoreductase [Rhizomicrobium sp.]
MADSFDAIVIGGGPGGYNAAIRLGQLGLTSACIDKRGTFGGTCLNVGCIPSKALLHASERFHEAQTDFAKLGIKVKVDLDLPAMMAQKTKVVGELTKGVEFLLKKAKSEAIVGEARITAPGKVEVKLADGKTRSLTAKHIIIATGSDVAPLPGVTIDEKQVVSSTGAIALTSVPKKLLVVGAGVIGLELGSVWGRLGAEVTVVEFLDRVTPGIDLEVSKAFQRILTKQGMTFHLSTKVTGVEKKGSSLKVSIEPAAGGEKQVLDADVVLVAIGRIAYTQGL